MELKLPDDTDEDLTLRRKMVKTQLIRRDITDSAVLAAMESVPRHCFVPEQFISEAYADYPLSIGHGQTISQPYIVASMTQELKLNSSSRVLEIGTGCGYQTALLARLVREVYSIEIIPELAEEASERIRQLNINNVQIKIGDGSLGWAEQAPFDGILVAAAAERIPQSLVEQLAVNGRMVVPLSHRGTLSQELVLLEKTAQGIQQKSLYSVRFVPMTGSNA